MNTKKNVAKSSFFTSNIVYVLILGLTLRLLLSFFGTLQLDQGTFLAWSNNLVNGGLKFFYNGWSDYLPGYLYVLWGLGKINLLNIFPQVILYKLPAIFSDVLTGYLIYDIIRKKTADDSLLSDGHHGILKKNKNEWFGLVGALVYLLNPAVFANSALWGQVDSLTALTAVLSIYLLDKYYLISAVVLAVGTLIKPQTAFIFPLILFLLIKEKKKLRELLFYCISGLTVFVLGFAPFSSGNIFQFIAARLQLSANQYPYTSVNAFNFWGLLGTWKSDNIYFQIGGYLFVLAATVLLFVKTLKNKISPYAYAAFIFASSFMFFTRIHERHLFPMFAPLTIAAFENPLLLIPYIGLSIIYILNLVFSYQWISNNFVSIYPDILIKFLEIIGVGLVVYMFAIVYKNRSTTWQKVKSWINNFAKKFKADKESSKVDLPKINLSKKKARIILISILIFAFLTRIYKLTSPSTMYFDEVYHAFTAKVMMGVDTAKAWEWWNTPPEGFAYEWTHPPLAKLGMVLGMGVFGQNSFGWRIPGALLGVGSVFLVYLISRKIFNDETIGLLSAGAFSLDGLPLVSSRIGMNDTYFLFFALLSIYFFMKEKDLFSAAAWGLSLSSKWSALWTVPIIFILWLKRKHKIKPSILWFLVLPPIIYLLSYLPMFTTGHNLNIWWGMQEQMWWYHTGLKATHAYSSPWWSWPFLIRPVYLYTSDEIGGFVSRIYMMGNPFVFWFGVAAVMASTIYAYLERNRKIGLVVFCYLIFFAPWAMSPRIMFMYHYLPSIPFLAMAIGYVLRRNPKMIFGYLFICLLGYLYFYPHWAGLNIPLWLDQSYYWISTWR